MRLLTYNVHDLLDDRDTVAHVIRSCRPDVVCLQEVPRRPFTRRRVLRLARETGLRWSAGGRGSGGTAVFTSPRVDVLDVWVSRLAVAGTFTRTRGYALARVQLPGEAPVTVASVHLPLRPAERLAHTRIVLGRLASLEPPYVVAGDLNEPPSGPAWAAFTELLVDAGAGPTREAGSPTYPVKAPNRRIDAVLVSRGISVTRLAPVGATEHVTGADLRAASDHLPLLADLVLEPPPSGTY